MTRTRWTALLVGMIAAAGWPARAIDAGPFRIHGCISQGYMRSTENNVITESLQGTLDFREYGLNASMDFSNRLSAGAQFFGREYGSVGNDRVYLDWLWIDYLVRDWMSLRAGRLKVPYGLYGETRDIDALRTEVLLPQGVYMEYVREAYDGGWALELHGRLSWRWLGSASYRLQGGLRSRDPEDGDMARLLGEQGMSIDSFDERGATAASLTWQTPLEGLRARLAFSWDRNGISGEYSSPYAQSPYEADVEDELLQTGSVELTRGGWVAAAEYAASSYRADFDLADPFAPDMTMDGALHGAYGKVSCQIVEWLSVGAGISYCQVENDFRFTGASGGNTRRSSEDLRDFFASLRLDLGDHLVCKIEHHVANGTAGLFENENPDGVADDWMLTLMKVSIVF